MSRKLQRQVNRHLGQKGHCLATINTQHLFLERVVTLSLLIFIVSLHLKINHNTSHGPHRRYSYSFIEDTFANFKRTWKRKCYLHTGKRHAIYILEKGSELLLFSYLIFKRVERFGCVLKTCYPNICFDITNLLLLRPLTRYKKCIYSTRI